MNRRIWENRHGVIELNDGEPLGLRLEVGDDALIGFNANIRLTQDEFLECADAFAALAAELRAKETT